MKKLLILWVVTAIQAVSCKSEVDSQNKLVGRWRLVEYCKLDQSNNCSITQVNQQDAVFIEFTSDKKYFEKYSKLPPEHKFLGCGDGSYEVNKAELGLYLPCSSSLTPQKVQIDKQGNDELVLNSSTSGLRAGEFKFVRL